MSEPAVVLLHGLAGSARRTWGDNAWFDLLADAGREVIGVDLLGHGTAPKPHHPEGYSGFDQHVIDHFPDAPIDAIGFSLGAYTLLSIASRMPERFHRLVVAGVGNNLFERDEDHSRMIVHAITGEPDPENPEALHFSTLADDPEADRLALAALLASRTPFDTGCLAHITVPVLVVLGDQDFAAPGDRLVECLPDARLVTLRGVDHFATPKSFAFIDAALDFLDARP
ncbi:alpha/beta fold hydrolase [Candidatus Poriferisocius sp.]|uniref:alpha/beta fold hydrolase n=1 Tax=Candidatus Poriferisocius sp. TaxID=3101276 RepID=UPI003B016B5C